MKLSDYLTYCADVKEEAPVYLFDNLFADRNPDMRADYDVPEYFREDFFSILPPQGTLSMKEEEGEVVVVVVVEEEEEEEEE